MEDFLRLVLKITVWMRWQLWLVWLAVLDPQLWLVGFKSSASTGGKDADPTFSSFVWWWGRTLLAAGRGNIYLSSGVEGTRRYLSLPPTKQDLTQGQWPEGRFIVGVKRGGGRAWAETRALRVYAGHRFTWCNVSLMSLAGHGPKHGSRHGCLIIA